LSLAAPDDLMTGRRIGATADVRIPAKVTADSG